MNRLFPLLACAGLILTACDGRDPLPTEVSPSPDVGGPLFDPSNSNVTPTHLVDFKKQKLGDLADAVAAAGGEILFSHTATGFALVSGLSEEAAANLENVPSVNRVVADESFDLDATFDANTVEQGSGGVASPDDPTTAGFYVRQWNMRAIGADQAWAAGRLGSGGVTIAILDTGIDYLYPDLAGRVDLSRSASFVPSDDALVAALFPARHPVTDLYFHGTHVAMTAVSNSNILAGVTSKTTLIGVKVCNVFGSCPFGSIVAGVLHAVDAGADVVNMSLGGAFTKSANPGLTGFINSLFNYANQQKVTMVVAAGNAAMDLDHNGNTYANYCDTPNTICVSATAPESGAGVNGPWTNVDTPTGYTNYGKSAINVAAPGGASLANSAGWVWSGCSQTSLVIPICQTGVFILGSSGTSMASPHAAGLAALLVEDVGRNPGRVKTTMQNSADDLGKKGADPFFGKGRINVANAVN